jgi:folate-binding protein YgfZ
MTRLTLLPERAVVAVAGDDRVAFLQGLVSNDVEQVRPGHAVWAALLTPQGKWQADFFMFAGADAILLDCEAAQATDLAKRLSRFRLRSKVTVSVEPTLYVYAAWDGRPDVAGVVAPDPRLPDFATRILSGGTVPTNATPDDWNNHRLAAGVPDGSKDMEPEKSILLEAGFDELHGVSWSKGCYMGQELTARTKDRGLVKRRLIPVAVEGVLPAPGTQIFNGDSEAGTMRSGSGTVGLASIRLDAITATLTCGGATLRPVIPPWMRLPETG